MENFSHSLFFAAQNIFCSSSGTSLVFRLQYTSLTSHSYLSKAWTQIKVGHSFIIREIFCIISYIIKLGYKVFPKLKYIIVLLFFPVYSPIYPAACEFSLLFPHPASMLWQSFLTMVLYYNTVSTRSCTNWKNFEQVSNLAKYFQSLFNLLLFEIPCRILFPQSAASLPFLHHGLINRLCVILLSKQISFHNFTGLGLFLFLIPLQLSPMILD